MSDFRMDNIGGGSGAVGKILAAADEISGQAQRIDQLQTAVDELRNLHFGFEFDDNDYRCDACGDMWPCETIAILERHGLDQAVD